jgi:hypothetical protein
MDICCVEGGWSTDTDTDIEAEALVERGFPTEGEEV